MMKYISIKNVEFFKNIYLILMYFFIFVLLNVEEFCYFIFVFYVFYLYILYIKFYL